jgi:ankyrin repeat protein
VLLPDAAAPGAPDSAWVRVAVGLEHLALDWLDADAAAPREARLAGRQQRLVEQTADGELVARLLAESGVDPNATASVSDGHGDAAHYTPLTHAAEFGNLEAVRSLLDAGADPGRADGGAGATPLINAAVHGRLEVLRLLLARGAALDAAGPGGGFTAFHAACCNTHPECAEALARGGCDVGIKDKNGLTGRELAEAKGHTAVVERLRAVVAEQLRAAGPAPEPEPARGGERLASKLVMAAMEGDAAAVSRLLAAGADPNASMAVEKPSGEVLHTTALCKAAGYGQLEVARLLLEAGADPDSVDSHSSDRALSAPARGG